MEWPDLPLAGGHYVFLLIFVVILAVPWIVRATRLPELVILIGGGVLIGPHGLGLIERTGTIEVLGTAGLLYLMFQAGLELDPEDFRLNRRPALLFGALTFAVPMVLGFGIHRSLGFGTLAALLLASCWASHTLLTYPMFQRARLVSNRAVSIGVAGTVITDTAALLLLVTLVRVHEGALTVVGLAVQLPALLGAAALIMIGLPRLTSWVFATLARDRATRFLFTMVALYGSAALAELVGVEPIIGAFLAGLALHQNVAEGSELAHRIETFGSTLLVPVFLISVGMLIDAVGAVTDGRTLTLAASFTAVVLLGKSSAAAITARLVGLETSERETLVALSVPQAAATLAAVFVGFEVGLVDEQVIDAVVMVIFVTCLLGSALAAHAVKNLPTPPVRSAPIAKRILMPLPEGGVSGGAIEMAAALGKRDTGTVLALSVLDLSATPADVKVRRAFVTDTVEDTALANGCEARSIVRLDLTPAAGIVHAAIEHEATLV
ncbi:MAG: cation:proton antiporter, partial [Acidimicrobiales bacterium]|nr:cation:proton antiporter [Acidimicrobiales bacterium]